MVFLTALYVDTAGATPSCCRLGACSVYTVQLCSWLQYCLKPRTFKTKDMTSFIFQLVQLWPGRNASTRLLTCLITLCTEVWMGQWMLIVVDECMGFELPHTMLCLRGSSVCVCVGGGGEGHDLWVTQCCALGGVWPEGWGRGGPDPRVKGCQRSSMCGAACDRGRTRVTVAADGVERNVLGCRVDVLGTNCDQWWRGA